MVALSRSNYLTDEAEKKRQQQISAGTLGSSGAPSAGAGPPLAAPEPAGNLLSKIAAANVGNTRFAERINTGQATRAQEFGDYLASRGGEFRQRAGEGTVQYDPGFIQSALARPESLDAASLARFNLMRTGGYTGPRSFEEEAGQDIGARMARSTALGNIRDRGALSELVAGAGGSRRAGSLALNLALLGQGEQRQTLESGYQKLLADMQAGRTAGTSAADVYASEAAATSAATNRRVQAELEGASAGQGAQNEAARAAQVASIQQKQAVIESAINTGLIDDSTLESLGISRAQWDNVQAQIRQVKQGFNIPGKPPPLSAKLRQKVDKGELSYKEARKRMGSGPKTTTVKPAFDPQSLYADIVPSAITTAQAMSPGQGARTEALARLAGESPMPSEYGGRPSGRFDAQKAAELQALVKSFEGRTVRSPPPKRVATPWARAY